MRGVVLFAATLLVAFGGCQPGKPPAAITEATQEVAAAKPLAQQSGEASSAAAKVSVGDEQALAALVAAHQGQVVFVDYWATWCGPCVEYFPHTVELSRQHKSKGLATIGVSFDDAREPKVVSDFLAKHGADFENLICSHDLGPAAFEAFGLEQVPHFRLYDRQGKLRHKWDDKPTGVEQKVEELLAEKS